MRPLIFHLLELNILRKIAFSIVVLLAFFVCFYELDSHPLEKWDEQVLFEVTKTSIEYNSFFIPRLQTSELEFQQIPKNGYFYENPLFGFGLHIFLVLFWSKCIVFEINFSNKWFCNYFINNLFWK